MNISEAQSDEAQTPLEVLIQRQNLKQRLFALLHELGHSGFVWQTDHDEDGHSVGYVCIENPDNPGVPMFYEDQTHQDGATLEALERVYIGHAWRVTTWAGNRRSDWKKRYYAARIDFVPAPPERISTGLTLGEAEAEHPLDALMMASIEALERYKRAGAPLEPRNENSVPGSSEKTP